MRFVCPRSLSVAAITAAAALAVCPAAFGDESAPGLQKTQPTGTAARHDAMDDRMVNKDKMAMSENMKADHVIDSQLMAYAKSPETTGDACFALKAAGGNAVEIEASKVIVEKAVDPKCKMLAQMILDDHKKAQMALEPIAKKLGVMLPDDLPTMHAADVMALKNMSPDMAEKAYLSMMKADHLKAVSMYTDKIPMIKDPDLKAYATETLPHIRAHTADILAGNDMKGMPLDLSFKAMSMPQ